MTYTKYTRWSIECDGRLESMARCGNAEHGPTKREVFDAARACGWILLKDGRVAFCYYHRSHAKAARLRG